MIFRVGSGLCISLSFLMIIAFSTMLCVNARDTLFFSSKYEGSDTGGRSLLTINLEDYGEPTANHGHDPAFNKAGGREHSHVGRNRKG
ncbi:hypothetical protein HN51_000432 [Arachis hypogaea]|nr:uncharacterized protein DS421_1g04500 [Arachis hypogaea]